MSLTRVKSIKELKHEFSTIQSTVAGDTRFSAQAILFMAECIDRMENTLASQLALMNRQVSKQKRPVTEWQHFFGEGIKAGKTPAEIGAEWRTKKGQEV
jgi:hypothetical protein